MRETRIIIMVFLQMAVVSSSPSTETRKNKREDYVPCEFCFGLYVETDLWKHHSNCQLKKSRTDTKVGKPVVNGKLLLPSKASAEVAGDILVKMIDDEIKFSYFLPRQT